MRAGDGKQLRALQEPSMAYTTRNLWRGTDELTRSFMRIPA